MKKRILFLCLVLACMQLNAQLLTWTPAFPKDNDNITIVFDASKGNRGLFGYAGDVYIHTGVITNLSANPGDWKHVVTTWNSNNAAHKLTSLGGNKYQYVINNPRTFFNVPAGETIQKIALLFRSYNPGGSALEGKCSDLSVNNGDMYLPIYPDNALRVKFTQPESEPRYIPFTLPVTKNVGEAVNAEIISSKSADLSIKLNGTTVQNGTSVSTITASPTITVGGQQVLVATATDGTTTATDTVKFFVAPAPTVAALPAGVRDGVNYESGDTSAILVLYAPFKTRVSLIGEFNNWTENVSYLMNITPDSKRYWIRVTGLTPGTEYAYQYLVDGSLKIGDPYAQKILDPQNDGFISAATYPGLKPYPTGKTTGIVSVLQTKEAPYNWQVPNFNRPDKRGLIIYELLVRDFVANHDWKTIKDSINFFKTLGINAIEFLPFNEFEGNNSWGYNPDYYFTPDKYYGPKAKLQELIDELHKNGIAVIMDIALNHSFGLSPMVQLYFDNAAGRPALNSPWFNPVQKHAFNVGYDMNHESLDTRYFTSRVVEHWLKEYKLDGFRFDLSKGFTQKQTCDANGNNCNVDDWGKYDATRIAIWKRYYDTVQLKSAGAYVILEHFAENNEEIELSNYGMMLWGNMNYNFSEGAMGYVANSNLDYGLSTTRGWTNPHLITYMESHDEERLNYRLKNFGGSVLGYNTKDEFVGLRRHELAASFLLMMPGPKMIWQFGELGYDYSINQCPTPPGGISNDCRVDPKPIVWNYYQQQFRNRLFNVYAALNKLRFHPSYKNNFTSNRIDKSLAGGVKWMKLTTDTSNILVVGNFELTAQTTTITFQNAGTWYDYLTGQTITAVAGGQAITLSPGEYHVYVNRNVTTSIPTPVNDVNNISKMQVQVYPVPLNTQSLIKYELPESGKLTISLINATGQQMGTLFSGFQQKGSYQLPFNSNSMQKNKLAAGVYLLQFNINNKNRVVKIVAQ